MLKKGPVIIFLLLLILLIVSITYYHKYARISDITSNNSNQEQLHFKKLISPPLNPPEATVEFRELNGKKVIDHSASLYGYQWEINSNISTFKQPTANFQTALNVPIDSIGILKLDTSVEPEVAFIQFFDSVDNNGQPTGNPIFYSSITKSNPDKECSIQKNALDNQAEIKFPVKNYSKNLYISIRCAWANPNEINKEHPNILNEWTIHIMKVNFS